MSDESADLLHYALRLATGIPKAASLARVAAAAAPPDNHLATLRQGLAGKLATAAMASAVADFPHNIGGSDRNGDNEN
jgi:hypothetical protein